MTLSRDWRVSNAMDAFAARASLEEMTLDEIEEAAPALGFQMGENWKAGHLYGVVRGIDNPEWWERMYARLG